MLFWQTKQAARLVNGDDRPVLVKNRHRLAARQFDAIGSGHAAS